MNALKFTVHVASAGPTRPAVTASRQPGRAFALLAVMQFALILAIGVMSLALPALQRDLGLTEAQLTLATTTYGLAFSGLLLLGGRLADRCGRRRMFLVGTAVFAVASVGAALAPGLEVLLVARFTQGVGAALVAPAGMALIDAVFTDPAARVRAVAAWGGISSAGATVGTFLGGVLAAASWRWAFAVPAGLATLTLPMAQRLVPPGPPPIRARLDVTGAVLVTVGLSALSYGFVATLSSGWSDPRVLAPLAAGVGLLVGFVLVERRVRAPLLPPSFLVSARRVIGLLGVGLGAASAATVGFFLSLYLQQVRGWSSVLASAALLPYFLILITSLLAGRLMSRAGVRPVTAGGLAVTAAGLLLLGRMTPHTAYFGLLLAGLLLFTIGGGLTFAGATVAAVDDAPEAQAGLAGGVMNTAMEAGPTIGLALLVALAGMWTTRLGHTGIGAAAAITGGYGFALTIGGVIFAVTALLAARTLRPRA